MNHVLELVGQRAIGVFVVQRHALGIEDEHLRRIGVLPHSRIELVGSGKVAAGRSAEVAGNDDVDVGVVIDAGAPLAAEEAPIGGIDLLLKRRHQSSYVEIVDIDALLDPEVGMGRDVMQGSIDLEVLDGVRVHDPELAAIADLVGVRRRGDRGSDAAESHQAAGQIVGIILRNNDLRQGLRGGR